MVARISNKQHDVSCNRHSCEQQTISIRGAALAGRLVGQGAHGVAAVLLDASPVEVVADVQDELWVELRRVLLELTSAVRC